MGKPSVINGGIHVDVRGMLRFCNDFDMSEVKRFYTISNRAEQPMRGWIGHRRETKWFFPLRGQTIIDVEPMDYSRVGHPEGVWLKTYTLSAEVPSVLKVPPANWFRIKQCGNAEVMVFSDCKLGEFEDDDLRRSL